MPWCPSCRNEHDAGARRCQDCAVDLVPERPPAPTEKEEAGGVAPLRCEEPAVAERVLKVLSSAGIPAVSAKAPEGGPALLVPGPFVARAAESIGRILTDVVVEAKEDGILVRRYDPTRDREIREHPILRESLANLKNRGEEAREALRSCLVLGSRPVRERARALLARFGDEAIPDLGRALGQAIEEKDDVVAAEVLHELGERADKGRKEWPPEVLRFPDFVGSETPFLRDWGIRIAGRLRLAQAGEALIALLRHPDPEVAASADDALVEITGEDLGFDPGMPEADRERIVEARRRSLRAGAWGSA